MPPFSVPLFPLGQKTVLFLIYFNFSAAFLGLGLQQNSPVINNRLFICSPRLDWKLRFFFLFLVFTALAFILSKSSNSALNATMLYKPRKQFIFQLEVYFTL